MGIYPFRRKLSYRSWVMDRRLTDCDKNINWEGGEFENDVLFKKKKDYVFRLFFLFRFYINVNYKLKQYGQRPGVTVA